MKQSRHPKRHRAQAGMQTIEFAMVCIPAFAAIFLLLDTAWAMFAQATVQSAVRQGVRWGVTCRMASGQSGLDDSIKQVVSDNSLGFLKSSDITIKYFNPSTMAQITSGGPAGGNLLQVSVTGLTLNSFGPLLRGNNGSVSTSAIAADLMEGPSSKTCTE